MKKASYDNNATVWQQCQQKLKEQMPLQNYTMWLRPIKADYANKQLTLYYPDQKTYLWIKKNLNSDIVTTIKNIDETLKIAHKVKKDNTKIAETTPLSKDNSFDNIIIGDANKVVCSAAQEVAGNIGKGLYNPFIIYGASGLGKTHLLQATGWLVKKKQPKLNVIYTDLMLFVRNITSGIRHKNIEQIKRYYHAADLLLVDDIHLIVGKDKSQEEFLHIYNFLFSQQKQIILASDTPPKNITNLPERLNSRFSSGLVLQISPPELEMRAAILLKKAHKLKLNLKEDEAIYIAHKVTKNIRELEGCLNTLKIHADFKNKNKPLDKAFIDLALKDLFITNNISVDISDIQQKTCRYFGITLADLVSKKRSAPIVMARQLAMLLSRDLTKMSFPDIGKNFGNKDHTTVIYACKKTKSLLNKEKNVKQDYDNLMLRLSE